MARSSKLRIVGLDDIGRHYATTLAPLARATCCATPTRVRALGYSDAFLRMWEFYFSYCEGGFAEQALGDVQMVMTRAHG